jgi:X-Pro dipeptidyl-peptidase
MTTALASARRLGLLLAVLAVLTGLPTLPASAATAYSVHYVPSVGGALIRVEIARDTNFDAQKQGVLLTYSPYNTLSETQPAGSGSGIPGIARAVADVIGTRGSTGCWDYGGKAEQQSGADVVKFLAGKIPDSKGNFMTWSSGRVVMEGGSYNGTTANMVAALGDKVPELVGIIPISAISRWYGYAFSNGVRYFLNSKAPTDEGFDTPLGFDVGFGDTVPLDPSNEYFDDAVVARAAECGAVSHTQEGYSRTPDYGSFWLERDYLKDASNFRAAVLIGHGWQDYNVKQEEGTNLYEALPVDDPATQTVEGVPFKRMYLSQGTHGGGTSGPGWSALRTAFLRQVLLGENKGLATGSKAVITQGNGSAPGVGWKTEADYPIPGTQDLTLHLGRKFTFAPGTPQVPPATATGEAGTLRLGAQNDGNGWTHVDNGAISEEMTLKDPFNRGFSQTDSLPTGHVQGLGYYSLYQESEPLRRDTRIVGRAVLDAVVNTTAPGQHLTPILADVDEAGNLSLVERGFMNTSYRNGLTKADPKTGLMEVKVPMLPQDYTFKAGHRIGLILQSSNTVWAVPGAAGPISYTFGPVTINGVQRPGTMLHLPVVGYTGAGPDYLDK